MIGGVAMRRLFVGFERFIEPIAPKSKFWKRALRCMGIGFAILISWVAIGTIGFCLTERHSLTDGYFTACLYISGVGPATNPVTQAGKLFAANFAVLNGLVFLAGAGVFLSPFLHRMIHHFHLDVEERRW
jgi:ABC-type sugar transport system permease subunit